MQITGDDSLGTPHKVARSVSAANSALGKLQTLICRRESLVEEIDNHVKLTREFVTEYLPSTTQITEFEKYVKYLKMIELVENLR